ncbi:MAG: cytochrome c oxidase assembly protein, partial [Bryobacteraceae bacterium]
IGLLLVTGVVYFRGWRRLRKVLAKQFSPERLVLFLLGLVLLFVALESPLDAFSPLLLEAHMVQHLLLMMVVPPLLLLGQPLLPLLRGLPRLFVKEGLGPFLRWPALRNLSSGLVKPWFAWAAYNVIAIAWHVPGLYELALRSPAWHNLEHACFFWSSILFWWPVVQPWPSRARGSGWLIIPYLLAADIINTAISASFVFSDKILYPTYAAAPLGGISPHSDQVAAGALMWVPGSIFYLVPAAILAMRLIGGGQTSRPVQTRANLNRAAIARERFRLFHGLNSFLRWRYARPLMQSATLIAAIAVVVDGFRGPSMAPMNLAGVLPWIHWRGLVVIALLVAGNLFCMACPFMLPRAAGRRFFKPALRWPSFLRSKWLAAGLFLIYLWAYEAFSLWNSPAVTAWIVIGYFLAAFAIDGLFRGASFCKYVCPLGQFNFAHSLLSPLEIRVRNQKTCHTCQTFDCIRGNETHRGCELYLFQPKKAGNFDCTFCLDCIHACPHDNVALRAAVPGATLIADPYRSSLGRFSNRLDLAALVLVVVFGAFANAFAMIQPFAVVESRLGELLSRPLLIAFLVLAGVVLIPACAVWLCAVISRRSMLPGRPITRVIASFVFSLLPVGAGMWAAHLLYHLVTGLFTIVPVVERVFGNVFSLSIQTDWGFSARPFTPPWLAPAQILFLDAGLLLTLYLTWRISKTRMNQSNPVSVFLPWGFLAVALYGIGIWIMLEPMQTRGMMMS